MSRQILTRILIPAATIISERKCKASELPIYDDSRKCCHPEDCIPVAIPIKKTDSVEKVPTETAMTGAVQSLENTVGTVRKQFVSAVNEMVSYKNTISDKIDGGFSQVDWLFKYLGEEDNTTPKAGAIAIGGLTGFILALRGGFFRKLILTSAGALGMASICYPNEASEYTAQGVKESKKYAKIGYNFIYGVKKDDPPMELPSLPTTADELWALVVTSANSLTSLVSDEKSEDKKTKSS